MDNGDEYVIYLLRTRGMELEGLDRQLQEGAIAQEYYLSCRRALLGAIRELNNVLARLQGETEHENGEGEPREEVICGDR